MAEAYWSTWMSDEFEQLLPDAAISEVVLELEDPLVAEDPLAAVEDPLARAETPFESQFRGSYAHVQDR